MKIEQFQWTRSSGWKPSPECGALGSSAQVVFIFGGAGPVQESRCFELARKTYKDAYLFGCTTAGEIQNADVNEDSVVMNAIAFEQTHVTLARVPVSSPDDSFAAGEKLARSFEISGLKHIFVVSEGMQVYGSDLVRGMNSVLPSEVTISGGFAGDGDRLQQTRVWCNGETDQPTVAALGFYGNRIRVGVAATGAWGEFGPERRITRACKNVLYELDGHPALALYKRYLGDYAQHLPASGLLFPLALYLGKTGRTVLRALLAVDEKEQSITFAGHMPEGSHVRFMMGTIEHLIDGTLEATKASTEMLGSSTSQFSILVSCNGRKHVLKQRLEEEIEAVREVLGEGAVVTGFYSYGEIAPLGLGTLSELHNETMTITNFAEV